MREVGHVLDAGIGEVAAGDLARAFEQMADHRPAAEALPVVEGPAERVDERREHERGIGDAAGDDHVGAGGERGTICSAPR